MTNTTMQPTEQKTDRKAHFDAMLADFERQRDELRVRLHLGKAEARDAWEVQRAKIEELKAKLDRGYDEAWVTAERFETAVRAAFEELRLGAERIRKLF